MEVPINVILDIRGKQYKQINTDFISNGDMVFDTKDSTWGYAVWCKPGSPTMAITEVWVTEGLIPKTRVRKLIPNHSFIC